MKYLTFSRPKPYIEMRISRFLSFACLLAVICYPSVIWPQFAFSQEKPLAQGRERMPDGEDILVINPEQASKLQSELLTGTRQVTFDGLRSGEGYFSADGTKMVFQSERDPANPFYQIFRMDLETGDLDQVSPGWGKTTCAWIHPDGNRILFASTQDDPQARTKQTDLIEKRKSGEEPKYAWDYDQEYELFAWNADSKTYTQLTDAVGYDAEGAYSPDGTQVVFASNRVAYERELTEREAEIFKIDPASMVDLYIMNSDGTNVRRLTETFGYDGGPFFSPNGKRVCFRRFDETGAKAEIFTMNTDGGDVQRLTSLDAMSWAPFYHPSGDYLIFTTNLHGFANFELYIVRADGRGEPVRVTFETGFDGLPVFMPAGDKLTWTSDRLGKKRSQIFMAEWNDARARELLGFGDSSADSSDEFIAEDRAAAEAAAAATEDGFSPADIGRHVDYLTRKELMGRLTGTEGERRATAYVAAYLESLGLEPAGENGTFFHSFEFPAGAVMTEGNRLTSGDDSFALNEDWRPLAFSGSGDFEAKGIVFAGYGMVVPENENYSGYDSYVHLDVEDKWVLMFRDLPQDISGDDRQQLARFSSARRKAMMARDRGAYGVILISGPTSKVRNELIRFETDASAGGTSIPVISVTNEVANRWFKGADEGLGVIQKSLDDGSMAMGFDVGEVKLSAKIDIERRTGTGRNVIGRLRAGDKPTDQVVMVGAHVDHLGMGESSNSLAQGNEGDMIHYGADDNASGVAAMLEIVQYLAAQKRAGKLDLQRDVLVGAWSGEELGLFGSQAFAADFLRLYPAAELVLGVVSDQEGETDANPHGDPHAGLGILGGHGSSPDAISLYPAIAAYLNLDMVGRLREKLIVQGIGSSPSWEPLVQRRNVPVGLEIQLDKTSTRLPTDAAIFVARGVPSLAAFTGAHEDYHKPSDTADKLNYEGAAQIARLFALVARGLVTDAEPLPFELDEGEAAEADMPRVSLRAYLGTIPDYAGGDLKGVRLSGVGKNGPAEQAGLQSGDIIVELAGRKIENVYDYTYAIDALKIGETIEMVVERKGETMKFEITPGSRD